MKAVYVFRIGFGLCKIVFVPMFLMWILNWLLPCEIAYWHAFVLVLFLDLVFWKKQNKAS